MNYNDFLFTIDKIDDQNIVNMLNSTNMQFNGYFFGTVMPKLASYALFGSLANFSMTNGIIAYNNDGIYIFMMSKVSNKKIQKILTIPANNIEKVKAKNFLFGISKRIRVYIDGNGSILIQANKKIKNIAMQSASINNFIA